MSPWRAPVESEADCLSFNIALSPADANHRCQHYPPPVATPYRASGLVHGHQAELEFFKFSAAKDPSKLSCQETTSGLPQHPATYEVLQHGAPRPCGA